MDKDIQHIIQEKGREKSGLIPILQAIQNKYNHLPEHVLKYVCEHTDISPADIIGVATFYKQFRLKPAGKHTVKVCVGTACHVKGAERVYDALKRTLKIASNEDTDKEQRFTIEKVGCLGCCSLAPVVQIDDITYGHVNPVHTKDVNEDFMRRGTNKKRNKKIVSLNGDLQGEIRIGLGSCCVASGSENVRQAVEEAVNKDALKINIKHVGCVGMCHQVPLLEVRPVNAEPQMYARIKPEDVQALIRKHFKSESLLQRWRNKLHEFIENIQDDSQWEGLERYSLDVREKHVAAFLELQTPMATEHRGIINPVDIKEYIERGGFNALQNALQMSPEDIISEVIKSGIKGRGGAGFPTGLKWSVVAQQKSAVKYIICNGDEGDPGAFMDRMLLESYPYRIIEGMLIAARALGASEGFLYIRAEYPLAVARIKEALEQCRLNAYLGDNIAGSDLSVNITVKEGAGAFVCGEETALIASMEGKRGFPYFRPPYPAEKGLWGKPTLINNAETLAQIPFILDNGHEQFANIGTENSKGAKVFALAGKIERGGLIEVPMGITLRQIVYDIGGGVQNGKALKAVQIGGPSGGCVPHFLVDTPIDYISLANAGAMMGSGGLVVLDEDDCMVEIARYFLSFTQSESCGKCTFCRVGTRRMLDVLEKLCEGKASLKELEALETLAAGVQKGSLCGLGKTAPNPVLSTLKYFREEYIAHTQGRCPAGKCKALIMYFINDNCIGCTICAQECPAEAIPFTPHQKHEIHTDLCIKCNNCKQVCPQQAVSIR